MYEEKRYIWKTKKMRKCENKSSKKKNKWGKKNK